jgi:methanogenic corrinoid protein MtbC1
MVATTEISETEANDVQGFAMSDMAEASLSSSDCLPGYRAPGYRAPLRQATPAVGATLAGLIAARILPRLVLAHREAPPAPSIGHHIAASDLLLLDELILRNDHDGALAHVDSLVDAGVPLDAIYLDLLAPAACRLGELWCDDTLSFADVTIGQVALQRLMRAFSGIFLRDCPSPHPRRRILLTPMLGEQHGFGHAMAADFFRRAGWQVAAEPMELPATLLAAVRESRFEIVGLSLATSTRLRELAALIRAVRAAARNKLLVILVGGALFDARPALALQVGADAAAGRADLAPARAEELVAMLGPDG